MLFRSQIFVVHMSLYFTKNSGGCVRCRRRALAQVDARGKNWLSQEERGEKRPDDRRKVESDGCADYAKRLAGEAPEDKRKRGREKGTSRTAP